MDDLNLQVSVVHLRSLQSCAETNQEGGNPYTQTSENARRTRAGVAQIPEKEANLQTHYGDVSRWLLSTLAIVLLT